MPEAPGPVVTDVPARQTPWSLVPPRSRLCPGYGGLIWTRRPAPRCQTCGFKEGT
jgi:hypothetical protein